MANPDTITIGADIFDVYGLRADADTYFNGKLDRDSWSDAAGTDKDRALVSASRLMDLQNWIGEPVDIATPQPLQWPRSGVTNRLGNTATFPSDIVNAYHEMAQAFIDDPAFADEGSQDDNTKRVKAGDVEAEFFTPQLNTVRFPNQVQELIQPYLDGEGLGAGAFASGIDGESSFCTTADRTEGFA